MSESQTQGTLSNTYPDFHLDYLAFSVYPNAELSRDQLLGEICLGLFNRPPTDTEAFRPTDRVSFYEESFFGPLGSVIKTRPSVEHVRDHINVELKGTSFRYDRDYEQRIASFLTSLRPRAKIRCSRIDTDIDIHAPAPGPAEWHEAFDKDRISTRAHDINPIGNPRKNDELSFYIGSAKSDKRLLVYNRRGFNRHEIKFKHDYANQVLWKYLEDPVGTTRSMLNAVCTVDEPWFRELLEAPPMEVDKLKQNLALPEIEKWERQFVRCVMPMLQFKLLHGEDASLDEYLRTVQDGYVENLSTDQAKRLERFREEIKHAGNRPWPTK